jgi:hypothetical protein
VPGPARAQRTAVTVIGAAAAAAAVRRLGPRTPRFRLAGPGRTVTVTRDHSRATVVTVTVTRLASRPPAAARASDPVTVGGQGCPALGSLGRELQR